MPPTVVLDANALMAPVEVGVRVFDECDRLLGNPDYVVPAAVHAELERLAAGSGEAATAAGVGLDLAERCTIRETPAESGDQAVVDLAHEPGVTHVVTNDAALRRVLLDAGVPVVSSRGQHKLTLTRP
ncbi:PIN domain-containing protein [Halococcoides cellulosivorans]|uniref:Twitching motility protein PilT n=1 Tax=Halococcoides cellulosivorans TaxID=1679096 RepID=A0A2R4X2X7_9EURY|nr:PIN domain-containing protein [Halococcoides cellulosivorans]AWB28151.1 twitching motility protein PilT [Halococcoides cellulosivorans]